MAHYRLYVYHKLNLKSLLKDRLEAEKIIGQKSFPGAVWPVFVHRELMFVFPTRTARVAAMQRLSQAQMFTDEKFFVHPYTLIEGILP